LSPKESGLRVDSLKFLIIQGGVGIAHTPLNRDLIVAGLNPKRLANHNHRRVNLYLFK
jgi:hypothetical protein